MNDHSELFHMTKDQIIVTNGVARKPRKKAFGNKYEAKEHCKEHIARIVQATALTVARFSHKIDNSMAGTNTT